jgi:hypothetical protein
LTPEQRAQARERYKQLKKLPPEKREQLHQRWQEYQRLPEEKRQRLREKRGPGPPDTRGGKPADQPSSR